MQWDIRSACKGVRNWESSHGLGRRSCLLAGVVTRACRFSFLCKRCASALAVSLRQSRALLSLSLRVAVAGGIFWWVQSRCRSHCSLVLLHVMRRDVFSNFLVGIWVACSAWLLEVVLSWEPPGAPVAKTPHCRGRRPRFHPWQGDWPNNLHGERSGQQTSV